MHEVGYCQALLPVLDARAGGRPVERIGIRAGVRHGLMEDVMQMAWQMVADGTPYADAATVLEPTAMTASCRACGHDYTTDDTLSECPACGAMGARLSGGDEFGLAWIAYVEDTASEPGPADQIDVDMSDHHHDDDEPVHRHHAAGGHHQVGGH